MNKNMYACGYVCIHKCTCCTRINTTARWRITIHILYMHTPWCMHIFAGAEQMHTHTRANTTILEWNMDMFTYNSKWKHVLCGFTHNICYVFSREILEKQKSCYGLVVLWKHMLCVFMHKKCYVVLTCNIGKTQYDVLGLFRHENTIEKQIFNLHSLTHPKCIN